MTTEQNEQPTPTPEPVALEDAVKKCLQDRGVKPKCNSCNTFGWANLQVGIVGWLTLQGPAQIALLICKKCAHLEPFDLKALGLTLKAPEPSRIISPEQALKQTPQILTG